MDATPHPPSGTRYVSTPVRTTDNGPRHAWNYGAMPPAPLPNPAGQGGGRGRRDRWDRIADDFWRISHNEFGKQLLHPRVCTLGMGAALLAELVIADFVDVHDGLVYDQAKLKPPLDEVCALVMEQIRAEPQELSLRDWLDFLASDKFPGGNAYEHVRNRMLADALLVPEKYGLVFRKTRYLAADGAFSLTWGRLTSNLRGSVPLSHSDTIVGGLALATDLHRELVVDAKIPFVERLLRAQMKATSDAERLLIDHLETAVGSAVSSGA